MFDKKLSFMLIPGSREKMRQFSISYAFIIACAAVVAFLFVADVFLTASFVKSQSSSAQIETLKAENELLAKKYDELKGQIEEINGIYADLVEKEIVIRNIFSLPEISPDERQLGIGGPENSNSENLTPNLRKMFETEADVDALLRLASFEKEKFAEVYDVLAEKRSILDHTPSIMPTRGYRTRGFGMKLDPFTGYKQFHAGIDIGNKTGTPIYATADGVVKFTGVSGGMGKLVKINHGYGYETRYGHLSKIKVKRGQKVRRGDLIGLMGSTGYSTGPHLHYEVLKNGKRVNPLEYILNN
ncbi:MAG TPA: M23 family metallopeptidase [candidate division Zixibacteria bacterium]|nr:M23 family metallopeptidase [candidate division Zixibacteria bacterium]